MPLLGDVLTYISMIKAVQLDTGPEGSGPTFRVHATCVRALNQTYSIDVCHKGGRHRRLADGPITPMSFLES